MIPAIDRRLLYVSGLLASAVMAIASPVVLDPQAQFSREGFWDNRDWDWYRANIPLFECPDADITTTYYYRWELVTKHLVYGSPNDGYAFTEFIDRPFWSGTYGSISCPAGHQLHEVRWLKDPVYARDYARYWFRVAGAQPRRYGCWLLDGIWAVHQVHPDDALVKDLLPDMKANFEGWEKRQFVPDVGMFWQNGHDDGMEYNINSRQTGDIVRGANGYRPGFNAYMWADAMALARACRLAGDTIAAGIYEKKAADLKAHVLEKLWDPARLFFFPMSMRAERDTDGNVVQALTLTYKTGRFAGSPHGRELHGYIPWQFEGFMDRGKFDTAWKWLMRPDYFQADFGPSTVERNDPMFVLKDTCCWWSGQSWPYATAQTLTALANHLQPGPSAHITKDDYFQLLEAYARTHRKNGIPYIAEACHPDTGSWDGHDSMGHSNHYFHSSYCDQIITGLVGLRPGDDDTLTVNPLAPEKWAWWALDDVPYRGHQLAIFWDKTGARYGKGAGLHVLADGQILVHSEKLEKLTAKLSVKPEAKKSRRVNWAVNNIAGYYPMVTASGTAQGSPSKVNDGNYWYHIEPPNRWIGTAGGDGKSPASQPWLAVDFGMPRTIDSVVLYVLDDEGHGPAAAPSRVGVEHWKDGRWEPIPGLTPPVDGIKGHRANRLTFPPTTLAKIRAVFGIDAAGASVGLTEIEAWGEAPDKIIPPPQPPPSLARNAKASASFTSSYDKVSEVNDGIVNFNTEPRNRWTAYQSKNSEDWVELDFGKPTAFRRVEVLIFDDGGGVQRPEKFSIQIPDGGAWKDIPSQAADPPRPKGGQRNTVTFPEITAPKLRILFTHRGQARSGVTEIEVWNE